ncbi:hypothetical protein Tco_1525035 [Tanacetum coccineum]
MRRQTIKMTGLSPGKHFCFSWSLSLIPQSSGPTKHMADEVANEENVHTQSNDPPLSRVNTLGSKEDRLSLKELIDLCTKLSNRVLDLETTKTAQEKEIASLKKRVKKLERKRKLKTPGMKRLFKIGRSAQVVSSKDKGLGDQEDASKQGRKIADIDDDAEVTLIDETRGKNDDNLMFDTCVFDEQEVEVEKVASTAKVTTESATTTTVDELTMAQTLIEIKAKKIQSKAKMIKSEKPLKKKDQIMYDQEVALNLQAQLQAELDEEEEANTSLIE